MAMDRSAKPFLVDLLQFVGADGGEAHRYRAQQVRVSFVHGAAKLVPEDRCRMPKFGLDAHPVQKIKRRWRVDHKHVDLVLPRRLDDLAVISKPDYGRYAVLLETVYMLVARLYPDRKSLQ